MIYLANTISKANILNWSSIKYKLVICNILATKLYEIAHEFDIRVVIKAILGKIRGPAIPLVLYIDSKFLYNCLVKLGTIQEKQLIVNMMSLCQLYK